MQPTSAEQKNDPEPPPAIILFGWASYPFWSIFALEALLVLGNLATTQVSGVALYSLLPKELLCRLWYYSHIFVWIGLLFSSPWVRRNPFLPIITWFVVLNLILIGGCTQGSIERSLESAAGRP